MPDPETDVEVPVEDAVEQEHLAAPAAVDASESPDSGQDRALVEANEADYAEQQSVVGYDDDDYR